MGIGERDKTRHERHSKIAKPTKWDIRLPFSDTSTTVVSETPFCGREGNLCGGRGVQSEEVHLMTKAFSDAELVASIARLWPHREHEAIAVAGLSCRMGLHYWRRLDLAQLAPGREVRFCFWCSKIKLDGTIHQP
jgi:hypothetical protein